MPILLLIERVSEIVKNMHQYHKILLQQTKPVGRFIQLVSLAFNNHIHRIHSGHCDTVMYTAFYFWFQFLTYPKLSDTSGLRVIAYMTVRTYGNNACAKWYFTFNDNPCNDPQPIEMQNYVLRNVNYLSTMDCKDIYQKVQIFTLLIYRLQLFNFRPHTTGLTQLGVGEILKPKRIWLIVIYNNIAF